MKCEATFVGLETGYTYSACARTAKVEVDGKHYCGIHDPIKRKAKEAQRGAIVDVRTWISTARWAIDNHRTKLADWALNTLSANHPLIVEWRNLQAEKDAAERRLAELDRPPGAPAAQEKRYWVDIWPDAREIVACNVDRVHMEMRDLGVTMDSP